MTDYTIKDVRAREIFDSRANPTVEVDVVLACGSVGRGMVPAGASTGAYEALELRDNDRPEVFGGKGVQTALKHVRGELRELLIGRDASRQAELDRLMIDLDGTPTSRAWAPTPSGLLPGHRARGGRRGRGMALPLQGASPAPPLPLIQIIGGGARARHRGRAATWSCRWARAAREPSPWWWTSQCRQEGVREGRQAACRGG